jgi:CheY-like chemotaxis protein
MKLLIVEDMPDTVSAIQDGLKPLVIQYSVAGDRESAFELLDDGWYDLAYCDLNILPSKMSSATSVEHGIAVVKRIRAQHPGMPLLIVSAYMDDNDELNEWLNSEAIQSDFHCCGTPRPMLKVLRKKRLDIAIEEIRQNYTEIRKIDSVEVISQENGSVLETYESRILKLFCRRMQGNILTFSRVLGGLSDSAVFRIVVSDAQGADKAFAIAKIGTVKTIDDERSRFNRHVDPFLGIGRYAPLYETIETGAGRFGGLFYKVAGEHTISLFDLVRDDSQKSIQVIEELESIEDVWFNGGVNGPLRLGTFIENYVGSDFSSICAQYPNIIGDDIMDMTFSSRLCVQHFDLHGLNVLVDVSRAGGHHPVLIDFASADIGPGCLDSVVLELSTVFHPSFRDVCGTWPTVDQARVWVNLNEFVTGCPFSEYIKQCRGWTVRRKRANRDVFACVIAYAMRQLKYEGSCIEIAKSIIAGAIESFSAETNVTI